MFGDPSPRRFAALFLLGALAGLFLIGLVGCGGEEEVDPYVYASLRQVMEGDTLSPNFLFEIDSPQFEYVRGNLGLIRQGNRLEFLVAPDLEHNYTTYSGALLGVQKFFSPTSHLLLRRIKKAGVTQMVDTLETYTVPKILRAGAVDLETPGADLPGVQWNRMTSLEQFVPQEEDAEPIAVQTGIENFVYVPKASLPDSVRQNPGPEDMAWYAVFPEATFRIVDLTPGAEWMLHMLKDKGLPLVGSFTVESLVESYPERRETHGDLGHVVGTLKINWFRYANNFVKGSA